MLVRLGVAHQLHRYEHDPAVDSYGLEAAEALGIERGRVFKTLVADAVGKLAVAVVPIESLLDLKALAAVLGAKSAAMAEPALAERTTGYVLGGISPLGQKRLLPTVVDATATTWETVFVSGGRRGLEIELSPNDLVESTKARLAPIARER
jgi:Cys-tRNA(Pro)/Cys-tRNA(Cys) deacylase